MSCLESTLYVILKSGTWRFISRASSAGVKLIAFTLYVLSFSRESGITCRGDVT